MPIRKRRLVAALLGLGFLLAAALSIWLARPPAPRYTVTDLGVLPGDTSSSAYAINSRGEAAGLSRGAHARACVFQNGRVIDLGMLPGGIESDASDINSRGDVTGGVTLPQGQHAFVYSRGKMRDLGTLPGFQDSEGNAINDRGEVAGNAFSLRGAFREHTFFYSGGTMTDLATLPGASGGSGVGARSINAAGQVASGCYRRSGRVRYAPFLYDSRRKTITALPMPPPYALGYADHVNDHEQVIGDASALGRDAHAALWENGRMIDLGVLPGFTSSLGLSLNNRGQAVGYCFGETNPAWAAIGRWLNRSGKQQREAAFTYDMGRLKDLNELIPSGAGWVLQEAHGINDLGQIVGKGLHHGQERAFLLTPVR